MLNEGTQKWTLNREFAFHNRMYPVSVSVLCLMSEFCLVPYVLTY